MTDNEVRALMIAFARMEAKFDAEMASMKEAINELKDWRAKVLMVVVSTIIVAGIGMLFGTGVVRVP